MKASDILKLELKATVGFLCELGSFEEAVPTLNCWAITPSHGNCPLKHSIFNSLLTEQDYATSR